MPVRQQAQFEQWGHAGNKVIIKDWELMKLSFPVMKLGQRDNYLVAIHPVHHKFYLKHS